MTAKVIRADWKAFLTETEKRQLARLDSRIRKGAADLTGLRARRPRHSESGSGAGN